MSPALFDTRLGAMRRDRAARIGVETFLFDRAFEDIAERLALIQRDFNDILLVGCPNPSWAVWLRSRPGVRLQVIDRGAAFASACDGDQAELDDFGLEPATYDLIIAIGTLDTINDVPESLLRLRFALKPEGLMIGAIAGGDSLPALRSAMVAADRVSGQASAHIHPRIDPAGLTQLLTNAGFNLPVVDVDRVNVKYRSLDKLVGDLRAMGATNILSQRSRKPLGKAALQTIRAELARCSDANGQFTERFEILHFMGWAPV